MVATRRPTVQNDAKRIRQRLLDGFLDELLQPRDVGLERLHTDARHLDLLTDPRALTEGQRQLLHHSKVDSGEDVVHTLVHYVDN